MNKKNLRSIILTSIITLLPIIAGLILWDKLPDRMPVHWGINGEPDGWASKGFAVFGLPLILMVIQIICSVIEYTVSRNTEQNKKVLELVIWAVPVISIIANAYIYMNALGHKTFEIQRTIPLLLGFFFVILGNYLPKITQNRTLGIKIKWTLNSEENWFATHRFGGKMWVISGILLMLSVLLPTAVIPIVQLCVIALAAFVQKSINKKSPQTEVFRLR